MRLIIGHALHKNALSLDILPRKGASTVVRQAAMGAVVDSQQNFAVGFVQKDTAALGQPQLPFHAHLIHMRRQVV